ncbi:Os04g0688000 [Oryza sativa Japonica Group]|uniref:Os04g0688000 protein n=1 Tax=Oryza sativa subsp. japonica TaxID=39947 RepID=C7J161_ORYSJ|nr:Os04g0688000 [Oryza sativa Japonica Group]|eukprot:NP_001174156.1 Os04g0688000 [Oryza sativa Japonica Group]
MPATDSSSAAAPLTSFGRSFLSHRRDQIPPPPPDHHSHSHTQHPSSSDLEIDAFHRHAADLLHDLLSDSNSDPSAPDLLSLAWTRRLLDSFLICLEEFRAILFALADSQPLSRPPLDRLLLDFLDRAVKALDLCNALRDGLDLIRQWRKHLAIAAAALATAPAAQRGEAQIRRARKALTDLTILMLDDKDAGGVVGQRNRSFGSASTTRTPFPTATATTAGAAAAGAPGPALAPISGHSPGASPAHGPPRASSRPSGEASRCPARTTSPPPEASPPPSTPWAPCCSSSPGRSWQQSHARTAASRRTSQRCPGPSPGLAPSSHSSTASSTSPRRRTASTHAACSRRSTRLSAARGSSWRSLMLRSSPWPTTRIPRCRRPRRSWCKFAGHSRMGWTLLSARCGRCSTGLCAPGQKSSTTSVGRTTPGEDSLLDPTLCEMQPLHRACESLLEQFFVLMV